MDYGESQELELQHQKSEYKAQVNENIQLLLRNNPAISVRDIAEFLGAEEFLHSPKKGVLAFNVEAFVEDAASKNGYLQFPKTYRKTSQVIFPPGEGEITTGSGTGMEAKESVRRTQALAELLFQLNQTYDGEQGIVSSEMARKQSYRNFAIAGLNKIAFVNDEAENASFIFAMKDEDPHYLSRLMSLKKQQIRTLPANMVQIVDYPGNLKEWQIKMRVALETKLEPVDFQAPSLSETRYEFLSYADLQAEVRILGLKNRPEYYKEQKKHSNWPSNPDKKYTEWTSWYDFLGKEKKDFLSYDALKSEVNAAGIKSEDDYEEQQKKHSNWPAAPETVYEKWTTWYDFLEKEKPEFFTLTALKEEVRQAGVVDQKDYHKKRKQHPRWPSVPSEVYGKEWVDYFDLLGKSKPAELLSYEDLQTAVKAAGIKSAAQYREAQLQHSEWPSNPNQRYKNTWKGWPELLGK